MKSLDKYLKESLNSLTFDNVGDNKSITKSSIYNATSFKNILTSHTDNKLRELNYNIIEIKKEDNNNIIYYDFNTKIQVNEPNKKISIYKYFGVNDIENEQYTINYYANILGHIYIHIQFTYTNNSLIEYYPTIFFKDISIVTDKEIKNNEYDKKTPWFCHGGDSLDNYQDKFAFNAKGNTDCMANKKFPITNRGIVVFDATVKYFTSKFNLDYFKYIYFDKQGLNVRDVAYGSTEYRSVFSISKIHELLNNVTNKIDEYTTNNYQNLEESLNFDNIDKNNKKNDIIKKSIKKSFDFDSTKFGKIFIKNYEILKEKITQYLDNNYFYVDDFIMYENEDFQDSYIADIIIKEKNNMPKTIFFKLACTHKDGISFSINTCFNIFKNNSYINKNNDFLNLYYICWYISQINNYKIKYDESTVIYSSKKGEKINLFQKNFNSENNTYYLIPTTGYEIMKQTDIIFYFDEVYKALIFFIDYAKNQLKPYIETPFNNDDDLLYSLNYDSGPNNIDYNLKKYLKEKLKNIN